MNARIVDLIWSFDGKAYEATGQILAWFDDPDQARVCADRIACGWRLPVDVSGTSLAVGGQAARYGNFTRGCWRWPMSHAMVDQDVEDILLDILDQLSTGNLPVGCDAGTERLIQAIRLRYPKDEEVQRLCAWFENQTGALGELVDGLVDCLIREDFVE